MSYSQMEFDCRLDSEKDLDANIATVLAFAYRQLRESDPKELASRHEGYGILAEYYCEVQKAVKEIGEGMKNYLKILPCENTNAIDTAASIQGASAKAVAKIVMMEAQARRVMNDMYAITQQETTPLEDYAEEMEESVEEVEDEAPESGDE